MEDPAHLILVGRLFFFWIKCGSPPPLPPEILHRLYYLPIVLSGLLFGFKGGVLAAVVVTCLFLPHWVAWFARSHFPQRTIG